MNIIPGEILLEEYLQPMGISQNAMARAIGVPPRAINEIVLGKRSITPSMSIRFGAFFGQSEDFWHGIQVECDFRALRKEKAKLTAKIRAAEELVGGEGLDDPKKRCL
jgi:addiction module HigA family antidote